MMRSLYSGVSGLKNHQTRMDVIGHNVANVNTYGYKTQRVTFQDMLSQTPTGDPVVLPNHQEWLRLKVSQPELLLQLPVFFGSLLITMRLLYKKR